MCTLLDLRVSSLRGGHANLLCTVPDVTDDLRGVPVSPLPIKNYVQKIVYTSRFVRVILAQGPC